MKTIYVSTFFGKRRAEVIKPIVVRGKEKFQFVLIKFKWAGCEAYNVTEMRSGRRLSPSGITDAREAEREGRKLIASKSVEEIERAIQLNIAKETALRKEKRNHGK